MGNGGYDVGPVRIKIANMNGSVSNYAPEYEDCRALAEAQHVPLRTVMQEAIQQYLGASERLEPREHRGTGEGKPRYYTLRTQR